MSQSFLEDHSKLSLLPLVERQSCSLAPLGDLLLSLLDLPALIEVAASKEACSHQNLLNSPRYLL